MTEVSRRLDHLERQMMQAAPAVNSDNGFAGALIATSSAPTPVSAPDLNPPPGPIGPLLGAGGASADTPYAAIYALLDVGISDPQEITRRVGLSRGEVDLILSLRDRRAL